MKKSWLLVTLAVVVIGTGIAAWWMAESDDNAPILLSFADCETAGYPIGESFPRQCFGPNGQTFVEPVADGGTGQDQELIQVHFSKNPQSNDDFTFTQTVERELAAGENPIETALVELLNGPTADEADNGLFNPIKLSGPSNCGGGNFRYTLNVDKLTLAFCKSITSGGIGDDARIKTVVEKTIKANAGNSELDVIILDQDGNCFGDMSGENTCQT